MPASKPRKLTDSSLFTPAHLIEYEVMRKLQAHPEVKISSLVVRRIPSGVCLQGVLESDHDHVDLQRLLQEIDGVDQVVNQLVSCHPQPKG